MTGTPIADQLSGFSLQEVKCQPSGSAEYASCTEGRPGLDSSLARFKIADPLLHGVEIKENKTVQCGPTLQTRLSHGARSQPQKSKAPRFRRHSELDPHNMPCRRTRALMCDRGFAWEAQGFAEMKIERRERHCPKL